MSSRKRKRVRNDDADNDTSSPPAVVVRTPPVKMEDAPRELFHRGINDLSDRLGSMSVKELREECATIQLKPKGNRKKLVKRLMYAHTERKKQASLGSLALATSEKQAADSAGHARKLVMSMFVSSTSSSQEPLRDNLSINSGPENPFPWPTDKCDDVFVRIAGLWRHGAIEYSTNSKMMVRIPGVINTTGTFHWFKSKDVVREAPSLMFSLKKQSGDEEEILDIDSIIEEESVDPESMSLSQLRAACVSRNLSKNGPRKKLVNRLRKVLQIEKQKQWVEAANQLPDVFVRGEFIYDRRVGKFHHSEISPNKACKYGLALFEERDYISASHLLRRYILETPASSTKETHGVAAIKFILSVIKAYPDECNHEIVKQEIDYAYGVMNQWAMNSDALLEEKQDLKENFERVKKQLLEAVPRLKTARRNALKHSRNDGYEIMERLYKLCHDGQFNHFQQWLLKQTTEYIQANFACDRQNCKQQTGMAITSETADRVGHGFAQYIAHGTRFRQELLVYFQAFVTQMKKWKATGDEWVRRLTFREVGLHEEVVSLKDTRKIFSSFAFDSNEFLIIQFVLICGLNKLRTSFLTQTGELTRTSNLPSEPDYRRKRRAIRDQYSRDY